ncbi:unnamed protein product [Arctogadus glacialis]
MLRHLLVPPLHTGTNTYFPLVLPRSPPTTLRQYHFLAFLSYVLLSTLHCPVFSPDVDMPLTYTIPALVLSHTPSTRDPLLRPECSSCLIPDAPRPPRTPCSNLPARRPLLLSCQFSVFHPRLPSPIFACAP